MVGGGPPAIGFTPPTPVASPYSAPSTAAAPADLFASEAATTNLVRNAFTYSAERLEEAMKHKSEAMDKRLQAKEPAAIEKAKQDLDAANKQLEEAKRQFEKAKRQQEMFDTEKYYKESGGAAPATHDWATTTRHCFAARRRLVGHRSHQGATQVGHRRRRSPAQAEEIEVLRDRTKSIEDQLTYTAERMKSGKGARGSMSHTSQLISPSLKASSPLRKDTATKRSPN